MNTGLVLGGGAAIVVAGVLALALNSESRDAETTDAPEVSAAPVVEEETVLVDPGTVAEEPVVEEEPLAEGVVVDDDGFVWQPLSYDKPQIKHNPDGTITMKKLGRIFEDGKMREVPMTFRATPDQRRVPIISRGSHTPGAGPQPDEGDTPEDEDQ